MNYATVCSGIEAPSMAWRPMGWNPVFYSENADFPSCVLAYRHPDVPNLGDMTKILQNERFIRKKMGSNVDVFFGGTPCQSFSISGLRKGLADPRGNLALHFLKLVNEIRPVWVVWENVPGVYSSWSDDEDNESNEIRQTNDFVTFAAGLSECGYSVGWRTLDAKYFGIPQQRRRVFVVGHLRSESAVRSVLFEPASMSGHPIPRPAARPSTSRTFGICAGNTTANGRGWKEEESYTLDTRGGQNVAHIAFNYMASTTQSFTCLEETTPPLDVGKAGGVCVFRRLGHGKYVEDDLASTVSLDDCSDKSDLIVAFKENQQDEIRLCGGDGMVAGSLSTRSGGKNQNLLSNGKFVRRLTPEESERLMGFPTGYTLIPWRRSKKGRGHGTLAKHWFDENLDPLAEPALFSCPDGHRYEAIGNSVAVPILRWLGRRIQIVHSLGI